MNIGILSFNSGELTPKIDARSDVEKYRAGCRTLENFIPTIYGIAERRPGTEFVAIAKNSPDPIRMIPFIFSAEIAYMCEFGDKYVRFYFDGEPLLDDLGNIVETVTPFLAGDLQALQFKQIGDTMRITHSDNPPQVLSRNTPTSFTMSKIIFTEGPFTGRNDLVEEDGISITCSVTDKDATGTLTASGATFEDDHIDSLWQIVQPREDTIIEGTFTGVGFTEAIATKGNFTFNTHGRWSATIEIQRRENYTGTDDDADWETFRSFVGDRDRNIQLSAVERDDNVEFRIGVSDYTNGSAKMDFTVNDPQQKGVVRINTITSSTIANITVIKALASTDETLKWAEGAWNGVQGFPAAVGFFEDRVLYAGTTGQSQTVWFSETDDFEDFEIGTNDAESFEIALLSTNSIRWIEALEEAIVGTSGDNWKITSNKAYVPITPTNWAARRQTTDGSKAVQAARVNDALLFVDSVGRKIRELTYGEIEGRLVAPDLNALAEHMTESGIISIAYQHNPDPILWCVLEDGTLLSMTYERQQGVVAWSRHLTGLSNEITTTTSEFAQSVDTYKQTYVSTNGVLYGIPFNPDNTDIRRINNGGVAVDYPGGIVGIPFSSQPWKAGDNINITGTSNYGGDHTLTSGTTGSELRFTDTFVAETFDGTETVVEKLSSGVPAGAGRGTQDFDGNIYIGHNFDTTSCISRLQTDGELDQTFITSTSFGGADTITGMELSEDGNFLYAYESVGHSLHKFNLSNGDEEWVTLLSGVFSLDIAVSDEGIVYVPSVTLGAIQGAATVDSDGIANIIPNTTNDFNLSVQISEELRLVFMGGDQSAILEDDLEGNLQIINMDSGEVIKWKLGGTFFDVALWKTHAIQTSGIAIKGNFVYVMTAGKIYKIDGRLINALDPDIAIVKQIDRPDDSLEIFFDIFGRLILTRGDSTGSTDDAFYIYDDDLDLLSQISGLSDSLFQASALSAVITDSGLFHFPGIVPHTTTTTTSREATGKCTSVAVIPGEDEDEIWISVLRSINGVEKQFIERISNRSFDEQADAFYVDSGIKYDLDSPSTELNGLEHLEGQEVSILGDGAVFPPQTVVDGAVTLDSEVSKAAVGLAFRYILKPMRFDIVTRDGTSKSLPKKISRVTINLLNSLNVKFGVDVDHLQDIDSRTEEPYSSPPELFTGDKEVVLDGGFDPEDPLLISGVDPMPCNVRSIVSRLEVTGK